MINYISVDEIIFLHDLIIQESGGLSGLRDLGSLISCTECPKMKFEGFDLYATLAEKAAALLFFLVKNHAFNDGNKRTAALSTLLFLEMNNREIEEPEKFEEIILEIACNQRTIKECANYFREVYFK